MNATYVVFAILVHRMRIRGHAIYVSPEALHTLIFVGDNWWSECHKQNTLAYLFVSCSCWLPNLRFCALLVFAFNRWQFVCLFQRYLFFSFFPLPSSFSHSFFFLPLRCAFVSCRFGFSLQDAPMSLECFKQSSSHAWVSPNGVVTP